ncbi:MAG: Nudix family hydrolase [Proteobacteria bacterium]|nr:Nudix family hydrolase [Pseudomonadota bacterium]
MPNTVPEDHLHVVAAVISDPANDRRVLISRRHIDSHQGGKWEFPGGKLDVGEDAFSALERELNEELGITVGKAIPFIRLNYVYPDKAVHLDVWRVLSFSGEAHGREGQDVQWVDINSLRNYDYPQANIPVIRALELPSVYAISAADRMGQELFLNRLDQALQAGLKLLQLREPRLSEQDYRNLAHTVIDRCHKHGAKVILNAEPALVPELGADGVQLNSNALMQLTERPLDDGFMVIASCHDQAELKQAQAIHADAALLSPVLDTPSHPGADTLGWPVFSELATDASLPVYALGGMEPDSIEEAQSHGAIGIAMITAYWEQFKGQVL